ncbi:hypothetical protein [Phenylobacterium sp.]|uniref:hypothetical protein n=1 Tax=Phenylobacterium sp. TaxID=1871053 RepID=UPI0035AE2ABF
MRSLLALRPACAARGVSLWTDVGGGEALIGRGRGSYLSAFLRSEATHLLFVDADVGFPPEAVFRLLDSGHEVAGGLYPRRAQDPAALAAGALAWEADELPQPTAAGADGFRRVAALGAGFLMITRPAAERLRTAYPHLVAKLGDVQGARAPDALMVFDSFVEPGTRRYLNDWQAFGRRWRDIGGEVWADTHSGLTHMGEVALRR